MQTCVIEGNFPPHCVPGGTGTHCTHSQDNLHQSKPSGAAQRHIKPSLTVPHGAMLFLSHAARGADGEWERRRKQLWSWMAEPTHLNATELSSENKKNCVCAPKYIRTFGSITHSFFDNFMCVNTGSWLASHCLLRLQDRRQDH